METVEPGASSELAQPLPTGLLKPPNILILTPPHARVGTGAHWAAKRSSSLPICCWKSFPSLDPWRDVQVSGKGAIPGLRLCPPSPRSLGTSSAPSAHASARRKLGREVSKLREENLGLG